MSMQLQALKSNGTWSLALTTWTFFLLVTKMVTIKVLLALTVIHGFMRYFKFFLGLEVARSSKGILLSQCHYALQFFSHVRYLRCSTRKTTMDPNINQFLAKHCVPRLQVAHQIFLYVKGTVRQGILFSSSSFMELKAFSNSD
ncbi:hypothetical protein AAG906_011231 [Vitis piasezkii]